MLDFEWNYKYFQNNTEVQIRYSATLMMQSESEIVLSCLVRTSWEWKWVRTNLLLFRENASRRVAKRTRCYSSGFHHPSALIRSPSLITYRNVDGASESHHKQRPFNWKHRWWNITRKMAAICQVIKKDVYFVPYAFARIWLRSHCIALLYISNRRVFVWIIPL